MKTRKKINRNVFFKLTFVHQWAFSLTHQEVLCLRIPFKQNDNIILFSRNCKLPPKINFPLSPNSQMRIWLP